MKHHDLHDESRDGGLGVLVFARIALPSLRAQSVQVLHAARALASLGARVTLAYEPAGGNPLASAGLAPHPRLRLVALPAGGTASSAAFRLLAARRALAGDVLLARGARYAAWALRWLPGARVVFEAHEVDSLQHAEAGRDPGPAFHLERRVLLGVRALICNCEGVRDGLARLHPLPARVRVAHNASPRARAPGRDGEGVVYAGSLIPGKDLEALARAAPALGGVTLLGDHPPERFAALQALAGGALVAGGAVTPAELPDRLADFRVGVLPLGDGWFGRELTSPLKAFAYQAARLPFAGADTPALRRAAPGCFEPYAPGDTGSLVDAVRRARDDEGARSLLRAAMRDRAWEDRAAEVLEVLDAVRRD